MVQALCRRNGTGPYSRSGSTKAKLGPSGHDWLHEIKHDGFQVIARKDGTKVRLYSRPGNGPETHHFPLIVDDVPPLDRGAQDHAGHAFQLKSLSFLVPRGDCHG
jgi:hypothetical protein